VAAASGARLDVEAAEDVVRSAWLDRSGELVLPVIEDDPSITQDEVDRALTDQAVPAASGPLTVVVGETTAEVTQAALLPTLGMVPSVGTPGALDLVVDGVALRRAVLAVAPALEHPAEDARIVLKNGVPTVIPSKDGVAIDPETLAAAAEAALLTPERRATVAAEVVKPELTTDQAKALGVKGKVSTFSTPLTASALRTENLRLAARGVNGTLVMPGKTFSLNSVLGERTPEKGYNAAPTIIGGRLELTYGGGISQLATTIFNNVFFSGLEDVAHTTHSFYISRYPEGREATVNYSPRVDLIWRNDSPYAVLVQAGVTSTVDVSFWSTKQYDDVVAVKSARSNYRQPKTVYDTSAGCVSQSASPGFDVSVRRKVVKDGAVVKDQTWHTTYIAEDKVVCGPGPPAPTPTPSG
jgi:vancomycin resistance protein YoaR